LNQVKFNGIITSGQGSGKKYLELPWVKKQIQEKLGYTAYPGTLNIILSEKSTSQRKKLTGKKAIQICPAEGYCFGAVFKAVINGLECAAVIPQVEGYPENILEVIAPLYLREALKLKDKDQLAITVFV
jgi:riboflavin kinase, archaea type